MSDRIGGVSREIAKNLMDSVDRSELVDQFWGQLLLSYFVSIRSDLLFFLLRFGHPFYAISDSKTLEEFIFIYGQVYPFFSILLFSFN